MNDKPSTLIGWIGYGIIVGLATTAVKINPVLRKLPIFRKFAKEKKNETGNDGNNDQNPTAFACG